MYRAGERKGNEMQPRSSLNRQGPTHQYVKWVCVNNGYRVPRTLRSPNELPCALLGRETELPDCLDRLQDVIINPLRKYVPYCREVRVLLTVPCSLRHSRAHKRPLTYDLAVVHGPRWQKGFCRSDDMRKKIIPKISYPSVAHRPSA